MARKKKLSPSVDLLLPSTIIIKNNVFVFFILLVMPMLLGYISNPLPEISETATSSEILEAYKSTITPYMLAGSVLTLVFYPFLIYSQWQAAKTGEAKASKVIKGGKDKYWQLIGLLVLQSLLIALGLVAFIIPGVILLRCLILSPFYLLEEDIGIVEAMKKSAKKSLAAKWSIYGILGIMFLFAIIAGFGIAAQICSAILLTLYSLAPALRFHEIEGKKHA